MATVALIGPDGAGKTTLASLLVQSDAMRVRYLYMGINTGSSNMALPTSRFVEYTRSRRGAGGGPGSRPRGPVWRTARLLNRVAEEWYRQLLSWIYQLRGFVVLYDRHFHFDFSAELATREPEGVDRKLHRWLLRRFYPGPDLIILLDAPGEVLHARKHESTPEMLEFRRQAMIREGRRWPGFVRVDATRPIDDLREEIEALILDRFGGAARRAIAPSAATRRTAAARPPAP